MFCSGVIQNVQYVYSASTMDSEPLSNRVIHNKMMSTDWNKIAILF